ncbi:hypothetical protein [Streptomyces milbemycinicus]|uniref:hypothetical protein n=1 Tax=Streptomyces milbemycinicus TaxID=476552 RepID=UPI00340E75FF
MRLEQGRETRPSPQVIDEVAVAPHSGFQRFDNLARMVFRDRDGHELDTLELQFSAFTVNDAPHQQLAAYQAEPASATEGACSVATRPCRLWAASTKARTRGTPCTSTAADAASRCSNHVGCRSGGEQGGHGRAPRRARSSPSR